MKKTLVALAVAAVAATSANAAVVYNQDGTKVDVGGSVRLLLSKEKDQRTDLLNNGSRLEVKASHDLGEGLKALAYGRLNLGDKSFDGVELNKLYAGFSLDGVGALTFGRQATNGDDVGLSDYTYDLTGVNKVLTKGDKVARFTSADFHGFKFGLDYVFGTADKEQLSNRGYVVSAFYENKFGDVGFAFDAGYSHQKFDTDPTDPIVKGTNKAFTLGAEVSYDAFAAALDYSQDKTTVASKTVAKTKAVELGLKYQVTEKSKVYTVFQWTKDEYFGSIPNNSSIKVTSKGKNYFLGVDYQVHPQVVTYLEGGLYRNKISAVGKSIKDKDHKVNLGLRVFF